MEKLTCDKGYQGDCCCNCMFLVELYKHPWNIEHKGSVSETTGLYACTAEAVLEQNQKAVIYDKNHGSCELYTQKVIKK